MCFLMYMYPTVTVHKLFEVFLISGKGQRYLFSLAAANSEGYGPSIDFTVTTKEGSK